MPSKSIIPLGLLCAMALASVAGADRALALEDSQILPGAKRIDHVSRGDLEGACGRSGGDFIETSEEYGCATDDSWVYCEKSTGDCVGQETGNRGEEANRYRVEDQGGVVSGWVLQPASPGKMVTPAGQPARPSGTTTPTDLVPGYRTPQR